MKLKPFMIALSIVLFTGLFGFHAKEIPQFLIRLKEQLVSYNKTYPEEKIYLHLDKPFYKPGEDIWFNAFVLSGDTHTPSKASDVVYVELIDPKGNVASKLELVIEEGTASGDFKIEASAPGGMYHIKAYTHWTQNFGEQAIFSKDVQVQRVITPRLLFKFDFQKKAYGPGDDVKATLNIRNLKNEVVSNAQVSVLVDIQGKRHYGTTTSSDKKGNIDVAFTLPDRLTSPDGLLQMIVSANGIDESISRSIPIVLNKINVQFFPEGGNIIEGSESKIGFKAVNEFGKGADVKGIIVDESNVIAGEFESYHLGMGAFTLKPLPGKKYYAKITAPAGNETSIPLPRALTNGISIGLEKSSDTHVALRAYSSANKEGYLVGQAHGVIHYAEKVTLAKGQNRIKIPLHKFPSGIAVFTLFDAQGNEQAERLVFVNNEKNLRVALSTDKEKYLPGEKVQLKVTTTDETGRPVPAKLSLSVVDDQLIAFTDDRQDNLVSHMLLSSEVKGKIEEPSFYFKEDEPKARLALDYLLMTQGWRRFDWREIQSPAIAITHPAEKVRNLSGTILNKDGKGVKDEVTLLELGNNKRIIKVETTPDGQFVFRNTDPTIPILLLTSRQGQIVLNKERPSLKGMQLTNTKNNSPLKSEVTIVQTEDANEAEQSQPAQKAKAVNGGLDLAMDTDVAQLSEVVVVGYGVENKANLSASTVTIVSHDIQFPMIETSLQGRVAGVEVRSAQGNAGAADAIKIRGISSLYGARGSEPLYVIDGHPVAANTNFNFSSLSMINPDDIQSIEIIKSPEASALFGGDAGNGVILITTKSQIYYDQVQPGKKTSRFTSLIVSPRKFSPVRTFYVEPPVAGTTSTRQDFRTTIYWNNNVVTNEKGTATLTFHNNDAVSAFRITAEGFTGNGLIGRAESVYFSQLPFSMDTKLPEYLGFEDVLRIPVVVRNETPAMLNGSMSLTIPQGLMLKESALTAVQVPAGTAKTF